MCCTMCGVVVHTYLCIVLCMYGVVVLVYCTMYVWCSSTCVLYYVWFSSMYLAGCCVLYSPVGVLMVEVSSNG